ncbi:MAG: hypothetical protein WCD18_10345 [Thermosynechococcaceae cyanobacterium]
MKHSMNPRSRQRVLRSLACISSSVGSLIGGIAAGQAQILPSVLEFNAPSQVQTLLQTPLRSPQITDKTPSPERLTIPEIWWADQQFGDKMVVNWFAYRRPQDDKSQVRLVVRPDLWSRYSFLERYAFLKHFGLVTSAAGYQLIVLDRQNYPLGAYTCQFPTGTQPASLHPASRALPSSGTKTLPNLRVPCQAWVSPVYGPQLF